MFLRLEVSGHDSADSVLSRAFPFFRNTPFSTKRGESYNMAGGIDIAISRCRTCLPEGARGLWFARYFSSTCNARSTRPKGALTW